jgi:hypothetical protein
MIKHPVMTATERFCLLEIKVNACVVLFNDRGEIVKETAAWGPSYYSDATAERKQRINFAEDEALAEFDEKTGGRAAFLTSRRGTLRITCNFMPWLRFINGILSDLLDSLQQVAPDLCVEVSFAHRSDAIEISMQALKALAAVFPSLVVRHVDTNKSVLVSNTVVSATHFKLQQLALILNPTAFGNLVLDPKVHPARLFEVRDSALQGNHSSVLSADQVCVCVCACARACACACACVCVCVCVW